MNILIVRPDGIGDVIFSLPVATQLRQLLPGITIGFLTSPVVAPMLEHHPDVDYVRTARFTDPVQALRRTFTDAVDVVVFLKPFRRFMWAAWLAGVPIRIATGYRWYSALANRRVYEHRSEFLKHESEYNVEMLRALGLTPHAATPPTLVLTEAERQAGASRWSGLPGPRVVLHPGGVSARRWPLEHYRDLAIELTEKGYGVGLTGNDQEATEFRQIVSSEQFPPGVVNFMGALSLRELMAVISHAQVVVSGATGPAHIAAGLGVPTVSVFDPRRNNSPVRWKPLGTGILLRPDVPTCDRCIGAACPFWDCLHQLTVAKVATTVNHVVKAPAPLTIIHM